MVPLPMSDTPNSNFSTGLSHARTTARGLLRGDVVLALGIVAILIFMLIPIPTWLLDIGLSVSILFSVFIMMLVFIHSKTVGIFYLSHRSFDRHVIAARLKRRLDAFDFGTGPHGGRRCRKRH